MAKGKTEAEQVVGYLSGYAGEVICGLQVWYEGLNGRGVPSPEELTAIEAAIEAQAGWTAAGAVRYEKFGVQKSFKRSR